MKERILFTICLSVTLLVFVSVHFSGGLFLGELKSSDAETSIPKGESVTFSGQVYRREQTSEYQILYLKNVSVYYQKKSFKESRVLIYDEEKTKVKIGNRIIVDGEISFFDSARNPGNFDRKFYYQKQNIHAYVWSSKIEVIGKEIFPVRNWLSNVREHWKELFLTYAGEEEGSILCAMILGDKNGMDEEIKELYQKNGIAHILAISGLHLSFVGTGLYRIARRCSGSYIIGGCVGLIFMLLYIIMIGMSVSALRATVMYILRVGADMSGRVYDAPTAVSVAVLIVILWRPLSFYDAGFQMSFGAVVGIIFVYPTLFANKKSNNFIKNGLMASVSIDLITLPIILYHYYEFPLYSVLLNVIVIPMMSLLLAAGIVGSVLILVFPAAGNVILAICKGILWIYECLCRMAGYFPGNRLITGRPEIGWILFYYLLLCIALLYLVYRKKIYLAAAFCLAGIVGMLGNCPAINHAGLEVTMLDVGQGDCIFLRNERGIACLVDCGSSDVREVGKYRIESFLECRGVRTLDYVFVTHGDADHIDGIGQMLERQEEGVRIECLVFPEEAVWDDALISLAQKAQACGSRTVVFRQGEKITKGNLEISCLWPSGEYTGEKGNEASMVLDLQYRAFDMLMTGDTEGIREAELAEYIMKDYDVLKVAHHGSNYSTTEEFLSEVRPEIALISAGRENKYGHPGKETLARLDERACYTYCTKECGAITLKTDGKSIAKPEIFKYNESYEKFE